MNGPTVTILHGDVLDKLKELGDGTIQCCVTSPPYWGLRDYSRCECAKSYRSERPELPNPPSGWSEREAEVVTKIEPDPNCPKCHGTGKDEEVSKKQIGLEPTMEEYIAKIVAVFREVKRVLRDDGTLWLNMGDCYANSQAPGGSSPDGERSSRRFGGEPKTMPFSLKPKDLVGMPWRIAFALQADGWYLRSDIIWAKPNPMPESVTDRPTKAHEYVFLLTKSSRYFYDADAVRESNADSSLERAKNHLPNAIDNPDYSGKQTEDYKKYPLLAKMNPAGRNLRTVWTIPTQPYPEAHFATFPEALAERCIKAGTKAGDVILDPFGGSGTVGAVARRLGRSSILIEIKSQYIELMKERTGYKHKALDAWDPSALGNISDSE